MIVYDEEWFRSLEVLRPYNERAMWAVLAHLGRVSSYVDVGCGDAWWVRTARMAGIKPAIGVENSPDLKKIRPRWAKVLIHDFREPLDLGMQYDLVTSVDMVDRLAEGEYEVYLDTLVQHTKHWLVFVPDDREPAEFWRERIEARGLKYDTGATERLSDTWRWTTGPMSWLPQGVQVFVREP